MHRVFVYGTLRPGQHNADFWTGEPSSKDLGVGTVPGVIFDHGFPIYLHSQAGQVVGNLLEVNDVVRDRLDRLEGAPHMYRREPITVTLQDGRALEAELYVWQRGLHGEPQIPGGDYVAYKTGVDAGDEATRLAKHTFSFTVTVTTSLAEWDAGQVTRVADLKAAVQNEVRSFLDDVGGEATIEDVATPA